MLHPLLSSKLVFRGAMIVLFASVLALLAVPAHAGPPLICHPYEIGDASSLPWGDPESWHATRRGYPVERLAQDTLALLSPDAPVLARMETLRRAAVYARKSPEVSLQLVSLLMARALDAEASDQSSALAWFDAGYFVETHKQAALLHREQAALAPGPTGGSSVSVDGYAWILRSIDLSGSDPGLELGAAMVRFSAPSRHLEAAVRLSPEGSLVRRNVERHFPRSSAGSR